MKLTHQFAFYINAYNSWTIKLILTGYPGFNPLKIWAAYSKVPGKNGLSGLTAGFILKYAHGDLKTQLKNNRRTLKIKYLDYDWSLNGK